MANVLSSISANHRSVLSNYTMDEEFKKIVEKLNVVLINIRKSHKKFKTEQTKIKHLNALIRLVNDLIELDATEFINKNWSEVVEKIQVGITRLGYSCDKLSDNFSNQIKLKLVEEVDGSKIEEIEVEDDGLELEDTIIIDNTVPPTNPTPKQPRKMAIPPPASYNEEETIDTYLDRVENYFELVDTEEGKRARLLLCLMAENAAKILDYIKPAKAATKEYQELKRAIKIVCSGRKDSRGSCVKFFDIK